jgi:xanthosine utilization system XapX-like protein
MRFSLLAGVAAAIAFALLPASAPAAPVLRACGNTESGGVLIGDVTTKRVTCGNARKVARAVPGECGNEGTCTLRGFSCITAQALEELRFARCSKPGNGNELFKVIRFDFGS